MSFSHHLRCELAARAERYAAARSLPYSLSYGETPALCFEPSAQFLHGNFLKASYLAITNNPSWRRRLGKIHTAGRRSLPPRGDGQWRELDSCMSSDALLMNVFCYPRLSADARIAAALGLERGLMPTFGFPARVPLTNQHSDRTEVDMKLGNLLVEAKLTEGGFQSAKWALLARYRDLHEVFDVEALPRTGGSFHSYQLVRNILATYAAHCSFRVLLDARRPDLIDAVAAVLKCVWPVHLRTRCGVLTWQELACELPRKLRVFLAEKYGIE